MTFRTWNLKEERLNATLDVLFLARYHNDYMVIFQDGDLHKYVDDKLKPAQNAKTRSQITGVCFRPQKFRPDAIVLDKAGNPHIVETKIGIGPSSKAEGLNLVVQTLVYANLILAPAWDGEQRCTTAYELFNLLHNAHWFVHRRFERSCPPLKHAHRDHFLLSTGLREDEFQKSPSVIFLVEYDSEKTQELLLSRIREACETVRELGFSEFKTHAEKRLPLNSPFRKRLNREIKEQQWEALRTMRFSLMPFYPSRLADAIGEGIVL